MTPVRSPRHRGPAPSRPSKARDRRAPRAARSLASAFLSIALARESTARPIRSAPSSTDQPRRRERRHASDALGVPFRGTELRSGASSGAGAGIGVARDLAVVGVWLASWLLLHARVRRWCFAPRCRGIACVGWSWALSLFSLVGLVGVLTASLRCARAFGREVRLKRARGLLACCVVVGWRSFARVGGT